MTSVAMSEPTDYQQKLADKLAEIAIRAFMDWQDTDRDEDWPESVVPDVAAVLASEQVMSQAEVLIIQQEYAAKVCGLEQQLAALRSTGDSDG